MYDAHTHLQDERFDTCREAVMAAAAASGVTGACCCGSSASDWRALRALTESRGFAAGFLLLPAFGVHPWHAGEQPADWQGQLEAYLMQHPEAPVGEIGIDGLRDDPPRDVQRQVLCAQLELAVRLSRPVVLHGARAWGELLTIIKPYAPRLPGLVAHAFGGSEDILREVVAMGGFVSFAGPLCNPAARRVRAAAAAAPLDRLLIETDAPDMLPHGAGSQFKVHGSAGGESCRADTGPEAELNHPANLVYVARTLAAIRGVPVEEIAAVTTENARRAYRLP